MSLHCWLERRAETRDQRERGRQQRGYVVAGVYVGNRTPDRRREVERLDVAPPVPSQRDCGSPPDDYDG